MYLKIFVGLKIIENGWHKTFPVASAANLTAISSQIANLTVVGFYDKYAEHLSTVYFLPPVVSL